MLNKQKITPGKIFGKIFCFIIIFAVVALSIGPIIFVVVTSFKSNFDIMSGSFQITQGLKPENYLTVFKTVPIVKFFINSGLIAIISTGVNLLVSALAAYSISRFEFKFKRVFQFAFSAILFIPGAALLQPLYRTITALQLYDTIWALIIVYTGFGLATSFYIMMSFYNTIPKSLEEAADIDGSSFFNTYFKIIFPLAKPALATAGVLQFLLCWNEFMFALILTSDSARTLPVALQYFLSAFASDYGAMFAATTMIAIPSIIIYILLQKQVIEGLAAGSVKG